MRTFDSRSPLFIRDQNLETEFWELEAQFNRSFFRAACAETQTLFPQALEGPLQFLAFTESLPLYLNL